MKILIAASEAAPFIKTGGLADVAGALAKALFRLGHDVRLVIPRYQDLDTRKHRLFPLMPEIKVNYGSQTIHGSVLRTTFPKTEIPVYFIEEPMFSLRRGIYGNQQGDFRDNDVRFAFFNQAILWLLKGLDWRPDVIHANDWQTGLLPALLKHNPEVCHDEFFQSIRSLFSVHNLAFQGNFPKWVIPNIGLPWELFRPELMEFYNQASFLKAGITCADHVTTVSPTYVKEIQTEENGAGMHGVLKERTGSLTGILNGIDTEEWDPAADEHLPAHFSAEDLTGKAACKRKLQEETGLRPDPEIPLLGMTTRLSEQKGLGLIVEALDDLAALDAQFLFLGSGEKKYEDVLSKASEDYANIAAVIGYDVPLSHRIVAGSDFFLVPSRFEPCGLTQMYAMRYGSVPIVRAVGGLRDTVAPPTAKTLADGTATGFTFEDFTTDSFLACLKEALDARKNGAEWQAIMSNGMRKDWGWNKAASQYVSLYESLAAASE